MLAIRMVLVMLMKLLMMMAVQVPGILGFQCLESKAVLRVGVVLAHDDCCGQSLAV